MERFVKTKVNVNFRKGAGTGYAVIKTLPAGTVVEILADAEGTWYQGRLEDGTVGFISSLSSYVVEYEPQWLVDAKKVLAYGEKYLGVPYVFGSTRTNDASFDCSDLMQWCFKNTLDIQLPWDSRAQSKVGQAVAFDELRTGDLIFFDPNHDGTITHVAMYVHENKIFHTASPTQVVKTIDLVPTGQIGGVTYYPFTDNNYYVRGAVSARRIIGVL